jgi:hypothetical protein
MIWNRFLNALVLSGTTGLVAACAAAQEPSEGDGSVEVVLPPELGSLQPRNESVSCSSNDDCFDRCCKEKDANGYGTCLPCGS